MCDIFFDTDELFARLRIGLNWWPALNLCGFQHIFQMSTILLKRVAKIGAIGTCATYGAGLISLYVDAPQADIGGGRRRDKEQVFPGWLHNVGRVPTVMAATAVSKMYLHVLNRLTCDGNEVLLENLKNRPKGKALLTVSNHTATVDDPGIFAG